MNLGEVFVQIGADMTGFKKALGEAKTQLGGRSGFGASVTSALGSATKLAFKGIGAGIGVAAAAVGVIGGTALKKGFDRALSIEDAKATLKGLGYDAKSVGGITDSVLAAVKGTAFALDEGMTIGASALASGVKEGKDLQKYVSLIGDAATIAKVPLGDMGLIFNKVSATGKVSGEVLNQLGERGIPILQWLAKEYGVSAEKMTEMVSKGQVDAKMFRKAIESNIAGAALEAGETTRGAWANTMASLARVGAGFVEGFFPQIKAVLNDAMGTLDGIAPVIKKLGATFGEWFTNTMMPIIGAGFTALKDFFAMIGSGQSVLSAFSIMLAENFGIDLTPLINGLKGVWEAVMLVVDGFQGGGDPEALAGPFRVLYDTGVSLRNMLNDVRDAVLFMWDGFRGAGDPEALSGPFRLAYTTGKVLRDVLDTIWQKFVGLVVWVHANQDWLKPIAVGLLAVVGAWKAWTIAVQVWSAITKAAAAVQMIFNAIMAMNPIGLIVLAVIGLVAAFVYAWKTNEGFRNALINAWNVIKNAAIATWDWLKATVLGTWDAISSGTSKVWGGIKAFFTQWWPLLLAVFGGPLGLAVAWVIGHWDKVKSVTSKVWNAIKAVLATLWKAAVNVFKLSPLGLVITHWDKIKAVTGKVWNAIKTTLGGIWNTIVGAVGDTVSKVSDKFTGLVDKAKGWGRNLIQMFIDGITGMIGKVVEAAAKVADNLKAFLGFESPTKKGPGSKADKWAPNFVDMYAEGFRKSLPKLRLAVSDMAASLQPGMASTTSNVVHIRVDGARDPRAVADDIMHQLRRRGVHVG